MVLHNLYIMPSGRVQSVQVSNGNITAIGNAVAGDKMHLEFDDVIAFPGLINSHDHLDFNLFPQLGNRIYNNYVEWGDDIHVQNKQAIAAVLQIPQQLRTQWGVYKNLLNGITTVVNHGQHLQVDMKPLINVWQNCYSIHSVKLGGRWQTMLINPLKRKWPFVIHVGEGTDKGAHDEINQYIKTNIFKRKTIAVHGVAMDAKQAKAFAALVWCPDSNYFLVGETADINTLKHHTNIVFGTDSALSASWSIWDQLRIAMGTGKVTQEDLFNMVTTTPAKVWNMPSHGEIAAGKVADIVVAKRRLTATGMDGFFALTPQEILLVIQRGEIRFFDETLLKQLKQAGFNIAGFSTISLMDSIKYVEGDLPRLMKEISKYHPTKNFPVNAW